MKKGLSRSGFYGCLLLLSFSLAASPSYRSLLKQWTRYERVFHWDNFEARVIWHATYLSPEFREARRGRLSRLYEWTDHEWQNNVREDDQESRQTDVFFLGVYAGSSSWPEVGKDDGRWRLLLEVEEHEPVLPLKFERIPITQLERELYPYLDKWSQAYLVKFPKVIREGQSFRLKMAGIPAQSELIWK